MGADADLQWCIGVMKKQFDVKVRGIIGPEASDEKNIRLLNRCIEWRKNGIFWEADPRHAELIVRELGLHDCAYVSTPIVRAEPEPDSPLLSAQQASRFRQSVARCSF